MHESLGDGFEVEFDLRNRRMSPKLTLSTKAENNSIKKIMTIIDRRIQNMKL